MHVGPSGELQHAIRLHGDDLASLPWALEVCTKLHETMSPKSTAKAIPVSAHHNAGSRRISEIVWNTS